MSAHALEGAEEGTLAKRCNGLMNGNGTSSNGTNGAPQEDKYNKPAKAKPSDAKNWAPLLAVASLQVLFICNFEFSSSRLQRDLDTSQERVHTLQKRLAAVEHSAMACYGKLNATELRILHESRIINDETRELRKVTLKERSEELELQSLRMTVLEMNTSLAKSKVSLRYEMEERIAAEKAAQASQSSVQVIKDQLQNSNDELKNLREKFHRENAKTQRKLSKAEKKAKDEEKQRQKYMEGMINLQSKLGHTKTLLENAAITAADAQGKPKAKPDLKPDDPDEDAEDELDDPLIPIR